MNTDRLIVLAAMLIGGVGAFAVILATVGPRADLNLTIHLAWTAAKILFAISVIVIAASVPFIATCFCGTMALRGFIGALFGLRFLRSELRDSSIFSLPAIRRLYFPKIRI